jgi:hypothetical protein
MSSLRVNAKESYENTYPKEIQFHFMAKDYTLQSTHAGN